MDVNLLVLRSQAAPRYLDGETVAKGVLNFGGWGYPEFGQMGTAFKCFGN